MSTPPKPHTGLVRPAGRLPINYQKGNCAFQPSPDVGIRRALHPVILNILLYDKQLEMFHVMTEGSLSQAKEFSVFYLFKACKKYPYQVVANKMQWKAYAIRGIDILGFKP